MKKTNRWILKPTKIVESFIYRISYSEHPIRGQPHRPADVLHHLLKSWIRPRSEKSRFPIPWNRPFPRDAVAWTCVWSVLKWMNDLREIWFFQTPNPFCVGNSESHCVSGRSSLSYASCKYIKTLVALYYNGYGDNSAVARNIIYSALEVIR